MDFCCITCFNLNTEQLTGSGITSITLKTIDSEGNELPEQISNIENTALEFCDLPRCEELTGRLCDQDGNTICVLGDEGEELTEFTLKLPDCNYEGCCHCDVELSQGLNIVFEKRLIAA